MNLQPIDGAYFTTLYFAVTALVSGILGLIGALITE